MNTLVIAAPGISTGQVLGSLGTGGAALIAAVLLIVAIRRKGRIKLTKPDHAAYAGLTVGTLWAAAGGMWASLASVVGSVPVGIIGAGGTLGNIGMGAVAVLITVAIFGLGWKRLLMPALLGIAASVIYAQAGGIWGVGAGIVRALAVKITGGA